MSTVIERIQNHANRIADGKDPIVSPGQPERFTEGCGPGETIPQGDLYMMLIEDVPSGYKRISRPIAKDKQLVPGNTEGAKHCLSTIKGVEIYRPADWGKGESLLGPCFRTRDEITVLHPKHGHVTVFAGATILCGYQPEFDAEQQRERRNAD